MTDFDVCFQRGCTKLSTSFHKIHGSTFSGVLSLFRGIFSLGGRGSGLGAQCLPVGWSLPLSPLPDGDSARRKPSQDVVPALSFKFRILGFRVA
jgi:hypothetical protein